MKNRWSQSWLQERCCRLGWLGCGMWFLCPFTLLINATAGAEVEPISVIAVAGEPFGVARIRLPSAPAIPQDFSPSVPLDDPSGRVFYPAWRDITQVGRSGPPLQPIAPGRGIGRGRLLGRITNAIRTATSEEVEQSVGQEIWFLFRGEEPFEVKVGKEPSVSVPIRPQGATPAPGGLPRLSSDAYSEALRDWWAAYTASAERNLDRGDYPPLIESYLVAYLARRLQLPIPESLRPEDELAEESIASTLELLAGTERMRNRYLRQVAQGDTERFRRADQPLPAGPQWAAAPIPLSEVDPAANQTDPSNSVNEADASIEPIASRVPIDSYYLRFGSFKNFLWFRNLSDRFGGDISRMFTLRGFDYGASQRAESQLAVKTTELSKLLGDTVVKDTAFIGTDLFLTEGASMGVLMQAKNAFLLSTSMRNDRAYAAKNTKGATLVDVTIAGAQVSLLSTPDNRLRSYLAQDGEYFLVTNSERLVEQFLEIGRGAPSMAQLPGFRYARELMPENKNYVIFAYFSEQFLQGMVGPAYQIELRRRLHATADIALVQLAQIAAQGEGKSLREVDELIAAGYLPEGIGQRPDGSGPIVTESQVIDSRRGQIGAFMPIADVRIDKVTAEESAWYAKRAEFYSKTWQQMDPVVAGILIQPSPGGGRQRLQIHAEVAPLVPEKYGWIAKQLGPPTKTAIQMGPDDIAGAQAYVVSDQLAGSIPPHHLFVAIKDSLLPNPAELDGLLDKYLALRSLSGYLGAWPQPGLLDRLPLGLGRGREVGPGMTRLIGGLYRYQGSGFSVVSFLPEVIQASLPHLAVADAVEPAQVRLHVDNLQGTQLEAWVNQQMVDLKMKASLAGAALLNSASTQLRVNPAEATEVVNRLIDARLQCPLGGEYRQVTQGAQTLWVSSAWQNSDPPEPAADFNAPLLKWFRGVSARLTQYENRLVIDMLLDMDEGQAGRPEAADEIER